MTSERSVLVARHGETDWNLQARFQGHTDIPLNARGREQAQQLAARLAGVAIGGVRTSDLQRARETGTIVAEALQLPWLGTERRLRERAFGLFEGLSQAQCIEHHPTHWAAWTTPERVAPPGAEAQEAVLARMRDAVEEAMAEASPKGPLLLVSHGACLRALLYRLTGTLIAPMANGGAYRLSRAADGSYCASEVR